MNTAIANPPLYSTICNRMVEYSLREQASLHDTSTYLFKRMFYVFGVNVYKLTDERTPEALLTTLQQHGHLDRFYSLVMAELTVLNDH